MCAALWESLDSLFLQDALELALNSRLRVTRSKPRHRLRGLDQAHPGTIGENVHRNAGLRSRVLMNESWN